MARNMTECSFYCINCGNKGLPIQRKKSFLKQRFHRKRLWCIHCKAEINHVECRNMIEVEEFKNDFAAGLFQDEAKESLTYCLGE